MAKIHIDRLRLRVTGARRDGEMITDGLGREILRQIAAHPELARAAGAKRVESIALQPVRLDGGGHAQARARIATQVAGQVAAHARGPRRR